MMQSGAFRLTRAMASPTDSRTSISKPRGSRPRSSLDTASRSLSTITSVRRPAAANPPVLPPIPVGSVPMRNDITPPRRCPGAFRARIRCSGWFTAESPGWMSPPGRKATNSWRSRPRLPGSSISPSRIGLGAGRWPLDPPLRARKIPASPRQQALTMGATDSPIDPEAERA
jgi:hypothetical protein